MFSLMHMVGGARVSRAGRAGGWAGELREDEQLTGPVGLPAYQRVAGDLRNRIAGGELPVGSAIPSTARLIEQYRVSSTVARAAVAQLRADGLVVGQPGKGVFVRATPDAAAENAVSVEALGERVDRLRDLYEAERGRREELERQVAQLRHDIESIKARVDGTSAG
jgi:DNA-binding GntR family transcriptional regulator